MRNTDYAEFAAICDAIIDFIGQKNETVIEQGPQKIFEFLDIIEKHPDKHAQVRSALRVLAVFASEVMVPDFIFAVRLLLQQQELAQDWLRRATSKQKPFGYVNRGAVEIYVKVWGAILQPHPNAPHLPEETRPILEIA